MKRILFKPMNIEVECQDGISILEAEHLAGIAQDAPCGGHGKCGKCLVMVDGAKVPACKTVVDQDMTVTVLAFDEQVQILTEGLEARTQVAPVNPGKYMAAIDIGTTTQVCYLLDGVSGKKLCEESMLNPQYPYGMDVISRIQAALKGEIELLTGLVRDGVSELLEKALKKMKAEASEIGTICIVGNPAMQQLFLGISPENLASPPFAPVLRKAEAVEARDYLPKLENAKLLIVPDISGYVGADTMGCALSTRLYEGEKITLMIDIGTNGEMILGNRDRMLSCSTAAGPALEGARISCGMRGAKGAIDHVTLVDGHMEFSVIGGEKAKGICGSGLIDLIAALLDNGQINKRGRIQSGYEEVDGQRVVRLTEELALTQEDVREVQMAKGAIAAGIYLMAEQLGITMEQIDEVILAGAFGSFIKPKSACRIGLIPPELLPKIRAVGNAAGMGSRMMAMNKGEFLRSQELIERIEPLELASLPNFQKTFGKSMAFTE